MKIKNVLDYEGIYAVTEDGDVYNLTKGTKLKPEIRSGYMSVTLSKEGKSKNVTVHKIVFEAFKGRRYEGLVIDHIDNDRFNNKPSNLRQIRTRENTSKGHALKSKYPTGVSPSSGGRYKAEIHIERERFYLGVFETVEEASEAYSDALTKWEKGGLKPFKRDRSIKHCVRCDKTKSVNEFYLVRSHGYSHLCKVCHKERMKEYREKNKL